jgi:hypothetical protein
MQLTGQALHAQMAEEMKTEKGKYECIYAKQKAGKSMLVMNMQIPTKKAFLTSSAELC